MLKKIKEKRYFVAIALSVFFFIIMTSGGINANDFFWHVKIGEWIVNNKNIPTWGLFSWSATEKGLYWTSHEWLGEIMLYYISKLGNRGIYFLCLCNGIILISFLIWMNKDYLKKNILFTGIYILFFPMVLYMFNIPRPQLFSSVFFMVTLAILYLYMRRDTKLIYCLPVITFLWGNIHGGMATLAYISMGSFLLYSWRNFSFGRVSFKVIERKRWIKLLIISMISVATICLNPNGIKTITFVFSHMNDAHSMALITEWAAPDLKKLNCLICAIPIGVCGISLVSCQRNIRAVDLLMYLAMAFLFLRSARFAYYFMISMGFYYFLYMPEFAEYSIITRSLRKCWGQMTVLLLVLSCFMLWANYDTETKITDKTLTDEAVQAITELQASRPYNYYDLGGELIYRGFDVFIDGRADMYQGEILDDYYTLTNSLNDYDEVNKIMQKYQFDAFYCLPNEPLNMYMQMTGMYREYYKDDGIRIWVPID